MPEADPIILPFPLKGLDLGWARQAQPQGTSPDLLNVMPFDATDRARGGVRPGAVQMWQSGAVDENGDPAPGGGEDGEFGIPTPVPDSCPPDLAATYTLAYTPIGWEHGSDAWSEGHTYILGGSSCNWSKTGIGGAQMSAGLLRDTGSWLLTLTFVVTGGMTLYYAKSYGSSPIGTYHLTGVLGSGLDNVPPTMRIGP